MRPFFLYVVSCIQVRFSEDIEVMLLLRFIYFFIFSSCQAYNFVYLWESLTLHVLAHKFPLQLEKHFQRVMGRTYSLPRNHMQIPNCPELQIDSRRWAVWNVHATFQTVANSPEIAKIVESWVI